jgi:methionyl-tRNA formyltransferase
MIDRTKLKRIGILGSRNLACEITRWMVQQRDIEIIGGVAPPFEGWWKDRYAEALEKLQIDALSFEDLFDRKPDIVFSINYWRKIEQSYIDSVPGGILNIHHSYLLKYRGRYSTSWAIAKARTNNDWVHGTTLHYINSRLDDGNIVDSWKCNINEEDTAETLFCKVECLALEMFKRNFCRILTGVNDFIPASEEVFYFDKESNKNLEVPWDTPIEEIYDFVRAWTFKDRPKPFMVYKGRKIYLSLS